LIAMRRVGVILHLTLHEAARRRILTAALLCGAAFLILFGVGLHFVERDLGRHGPLTVLERKVILNMLTLAGLFATKFLLVMAAVMLPVDTLSGEINSGVIQTVAAKPIRRSEIVIGKWLGHWLVMAGYFALLAFGVLLIAKVVGHFSPPNVAQGLPLILLEGTVLLTLSIAGGARFSTITNGMLCFGLYGFAFIGNWVEQIGTITDNAPARNVGTIASLIMPGEALWERAAWFMQPTITRELGNSPFSPLSVPSAAMVGWAAGYIAVMLALAILWMRKRAL
jgi:Cu-processing system permease protein